MLSFSEGGRGRGGAELSNGEKQGENYEKSIEFGMRFFFTSSFR